MRKPLVCLSHLPWMPTSNRTQQLIGRLKDIDVIFFEPPSYDGKHVRWPKGYQVRPNIQAYTLPRHPYLDTRTLPRYAKGKALRYVKKVLDSCQVEEPTLWLTSPMHYPLAEELPYQALIYDCAQEWDFLPLDWESELALHADVAFTASAGLAERLAPCCDNIAIIPNGVNFGLFNRDELEPPMILRESPRPILVRTGPVSSDLELEPLLYAAKARPNWTFLLLGSISQGPDRILSKYPNILRPGRVQAVETADWLSACQICFELLSEETKGTDILPDRFYEYLAMGKPVVLMLMPGQEEPYADLIYTATNSEEFVDLCEFALREDKSWFAPRRRAAAYKAQWARRVKEVQHILEAAALL